VTVLKIYKLLRRVYHLFDYDYEALFCLSLSHRLKAYSYIFLVSPSFSCSTVCDVKLRVILIWILLLGV